MTELNKEGLLPCPFCGGDAAQRKLPDTYLDRYNDYFVQCLSCKAKAVSVTAHEDDAHGAIQKAIAAWNTRARTPAQVVATHRHKKRGTEYVLIGVGKIQTENWQRAVPGFAFHVGEAVDMREVTVYRSADDESLWVRPIEEFKDGRFETLTKEKPNADGYDQFWSALSPAPAAQVTGEMEVVAQLQEMLDRTRDCTVCDGDGIKDNGSECGGCGGKGRNHVFSGKDRAALSAALQAPPAQEEETRAETDAEHIARDIKEGRFPKRSERKTVPAAIATYKAKNAEFGWTGRHYSFAGGTLYTDEDGSGWFGFDEEELGWERDPGHPKEYRIAKIPSAELLELRDYLNEAFPTTPAPQGEAEPRFPHSGMTVSQAVEMMSGTHPTSLSVAVEALERAREFIENGIEFQFIHMDNVAEGDPAHETLPLIRTALATIKGDRDK